MGFVTIVLFVNATIILGGLTVACRLLGVWPLNRRSDDTSVLSPDRRAKLGAFAICAVLASYSLWLCLTIEHKNRVCGNFLPMPYHPRGWRRVHASEWQFRFVRGIERDRPLAPPEAAALQAELEQAENSNTLHDYVEASLKVHVFVPLAFIWLGALVLSPGTPRSVQMVSVPLFASLAASAYLMITRSYLVALMGD